MTKKRSRLSNDAFLADLMTGLDHVVGHLRSHQEMEKSRLGHIEAKTGDPYACMGGLERQAETATMVAWFRDGDLLACKQQAYTVAKIDRIRRQKNRWWGVGSPISFGFFDPAFLLLSDHEPLIAWHADFEWYNGWNGEQERPKNFALTTYQDLYCGYQTTLALRGDWRRLGDRSERWLDAPPSRLKRFVPDMQFFLCLAKGDVPGMEMALAEIVSPKQRHWRESWHGGYTRRLISEEAVVYAKLAWRHGYQVDVDTPYIPKEWLPVKPLDEYTDPYDFMRDFDINRPLPD